jgi:catalase
VTQHDLDEAFDDQSGDRLTTAHGLGVDDTDHSLTAGPRGPVLLEDHHLREELTHLDHERIPERVVHARGAGAHGTFRSCGNDASVTGVEVVGAGAADGLADVVRSALSLHRSWERLAPLAGH